MEINIPSEWVTEIQRFDTYQYEDETGRLAAVFQFVRLHQNLFRDQDAALRQRLTQLFNLTQSDSVKYVTSSYTFKKRSWRKANGTFRVHGSNWVFTAMLHIDDTASWLIWVANKQADATSEIASSRIFNSFQFGQNK